jgi:hypothetical protein
VQNAFSEEFALPTSIVRAILSRLVAKDRTELLKEVLQIEMSKISMFDPFVPAHPSLIITGPTHVKYPSLGESKIECPFIAL